MKSTFIDVPNPLTIKTFQVSHDRFRSLQGRKDKMKKVLKWIGIVLGVIIAALLLVVIGLFVYGNLRLSAVHTFPDDNISIPTDAASLAHGKHLVSILCSDCHGQDLSGKSPWFAWAPMGSVDSINLTSGAGGIGSTFTDRNYVQAIRHAIDPQGHGTFMVSVLAFQNLSDADLGAIIAYVKSVPPVDHQTNGKQFTPMAKILLAVGMIPWPVDLAAHKENITAPAPGATVEYGAYMVNSFGCKDCHGKNLSGGPHPQPNINFTVPNITPGSEVKSWTEAQFMTALRTGVTPSGHALNPDLMPWKQWSMFSDDEIKAIFMYLQSVPALPQNYSRQ